MDRVSIVVNVYESSQERKERAKPALTFQVKTLADFDRIVNDNIEKYLLFMTPSGKVMKWQGCRYILSQTEEKKEAENKSAVE